MKRVLIIDDDEDILEVVSHLLTSYGFKVQAHSSGFNVPEVVESYNPNLVLLDINLPGKTGVKICNELKQNNDITVILFSGNADIKKTYEESDADGFIGKPFEINHLLNTLSTHLNSRMTIF